VINGSHSRREAYSNIDVVFSGRQRGLLVEKYLFILQSRGSTGLQAGFRVTWTGHKSPEHWVRSRADPCQMRRKRHLCCARSCPGPGQLTNTLNDAADIEIATVPSVVAQLTGPAPTGGHRFCQWLPRVATAFVGGSHRWPTRPTAAFVGCWPSSSAPPHCGSVPDGPSRKTYGQTVHCGMQATFFRPRRTIAAWVKKKKNR